MSRLARQNGLKLAAVKSIPTQPVLTQMQHLARQNLGRMVSLPWQVQADGPEFVLGATYQLPNKDLINRRAQQDTSELEWSLTRILADEEEQVVWAHRTGDLFLVLNLLSLEAHDPAQAGEEQQTPTSFLQEPPTANLAEISLSEHKDLLQNVALAGSLAEEDFAGILQSINLCKMTGRLDVQDQVHQSELYFDNGILVHATYQTSLAMGAGNVTVGDQVALDVITWEKGDYFFHRARKTSEKTIKRKLEALLLTGMALKDYAKYIQKQGVNLDSVLQPPPKSISEAEIQERLEDGVPVDASVQRKFLEAINGSASVGGIIDGLKLSKSVWLPILFNLLSCELVGGDNLTQQASEKNAAVQIDHASITHAGRQLLRPETGLLSYPLFLHFLKQEFARNRASNTYFSIAVFELNYKGEPLSNRALQQVAECFDSKKREFDLLGHSQTFDFILLLPLWHDGHTRTFCQNFLTVLQQAKLDGIVEPQDLHAHFGIGTAPDDGTELESLLIDTLRAKDRCKAGGAVCSTIRDARWEELRQAGEQATKSKNLNNAEAIWATAVEEASKFDHSDERLDLSLTRVIAIYRERGKQHLEEQSLAKLLETRSANPNSPVLSVAGVKSELAQCYYLQGKYADAELLSQQIVDSLIPQVGIEHPLVVNALTNLATIYHVQQQYARAEEAYKKALDILSSVYGENHVETMKLSNNFAKLLKTVEAMKSRQGGAAVITGTWSTISESLPQLHGE